MSLVTIFCEKKNRMTTKRKLLFVCFNNNSCAIMHALWYAEELHARGHTVKILFEGEATRALDGDDAAVVEAIGNAQQRGFVAGVCKAASNAMGCSQAPDVREAMGKDGWKSPLHAAAERLGIPLLDGMHGHASVADFVDQGFEIVTF